MLIKTSWLCLLTSVGLMIWAGIWIIETSPDEQVLIVEETEKDIGQLEVGTCTLELRIFNMSEQPHRIIGIEGG